jgi:putative nucleotidyltransferase with HDIG domain
MLDNIRLEIYQPVLLEELVGTGQELPSLPEVYQRVREQLEDERIGVEEIGATIQNDPAITSHILKMVNSSYYGLPRQVSSVVQAVNLLGRERCKHVLIGSVLKGVFSAQDNPAFSMQVFWQHSIKTAIIARQLAAHIDAIAEPEAMFTAGILHDIGKLILFERFPQAMLAAEETMIRRRLDELTAELGQMGMTHTAVGEALMLHWGLPEILIDCTRYHHEAVHDGPNRHATHLIYLANRLSEYVPPLDEAETEAILDDIENWHMGNLSFDQIASACQNADDLVFEVMESLGMVAIDNDDDIDDE